LDSSSIPADEFRERQRRALEAVAEQGYAALLAWSRMGTDMYWYGDVFYLTNHHSAVGQLQELPTWSGRGYNVLILPVEGDPTLIVDLPDCPRERVHVEDIRFTLHVPQLVGDVLREKRLDQERLAIAGRETLLASTRDQLEAAVGHSLELAFADELVEDLRMVKSANELELMRQATDVGVGCMQVMMEAIRPGVTEGTIVGEGLRYFAEHGGYPYDIAVTSGPTAKNYWRPSGPPHWDSERPLEVGDSIHVDLWGPVEGYYTDFARSTIVGGSPSDAQLALLEGSIACVESVLNNVRAGTPVAELYQRGAEWLEREGWLGTSAGGASGDYGLHSYCPIFGHGIGVVLENPWIVADSPIVLEENMTLAVESMLAQGSDGANFEHDIIVTNEGFEILDSACPDRWWLGAA
jgi:Xaa-Pro aminopeptidase